MPRGGNGERGDWRSVNPSGAVIISSPRLQRSLHLAVSLRCRSYGHSTAPMIRRAAEKEKGA